MKRKFGIVAVAALSTMAFSQLVLADSYDFWTANTPERAGTQAASSKVVPVGSAAVFEEFNEFTAVAPKRAADASAASRPVTVGSTAASVSAGSYDYWLEKTPKRAGS